MGRVRQSATCIALCFVLMSICAPGTSRASGAPIWNQFNEPVANGIGQDQLKLSMGFTGGVQSPAPLGSVVGEMEYFLRDRVAMSASTGITLMRRSGAPHVLPLMGGLSFHALPKRPFDVYGALRAGMVIVFPDASKTGEPVSELGSRTDFVAGMSYYYWGKFHVEAEGGYYLFRGNEQAANDLSGFVMTIKTGLFL